VDKDGYNLILKDKIVNEWTLSIFIGGNPQSDVGWLMENR